MLADDDDPVGTGHPAETRQRGRGVGSSENGRAHPSMIVSARPLGKGRAAYASTIPVLRVFVTTSGRA
jgi:hypothetical protein